MDRLRELLETIGKQGLARSRLRGLLHVLIGRRITTAQGDVVSAGLTWRELAALLKRLRWPTETVADLGLDEAALPVRDRERFWYAAIGRADVGSSAASEEGDALVEPLRQAGYIIGPAPGAAPKKGRQRGSSRGRSQEGS
jgi:hypothetical protein